MGTVLYSASQNGFGLTSIILVATVALTIWSVR